MLRAIFPRAREDFTGSPENTPAQRVDGLAVEDNFGRQPRNGLVPTGDLIVQVLSFIGGHAMTATLRPPESSCDAWDPAYGFPSNRSW